MSHECYLFLQGFYSERYKQYGILWFNYCPVCFISDILTSGFLQFREKLEHVSEQSIIIHFCKMVLLVWYSFS